MEEKEPEENGEIHPHQIDEIISNDPQLTKIVTPTDDWTYWAKWIGNFFLIVGTLLTNLELMPVNYIFSLIGLALWATVAAQWNDRSLVVLNVFLLGTVMMTLAQHIKEFFL
jgi:hypothetical protein